MRLACSAATEDKLVIDGRQRREDGAKVHERALENFIVLTFGALRDPEKGEIGWKHLDIFADRTGCHHTRTMLMGT